MGKAEPWQETLADEFKDERAIFYNPRRPDWDSSWTQDPSEGTPFTEQVTWELSHIMKSDWVVFYFDPKTKSPVTMLELGLCIGLRKKMIVCCPDGFWRKGNVVLSCNIANTPVLNSFEELVVELKQII